MKQNSPNIEQSAGNSVEMATIDQQNAGQRIDNFLLARLKGVPRSRIYRILRKGEVRVNKGRIKATYRLKAGDVVRIPPVRRSERTALQDISPGLRQLLLDAIVYEDDDLLILDKPSGLAVHGGSGIKSGLIESIRTIKPVWTTLELAHRIDRETSGCLILAKQRSSLNALHELFREGQINKGYLTLVAGIWDSKNTMIDAPLDRNNRTEGERNVKVSEQGKRAVSHFKLLSHYRKQLSCSMLEVRIDTGRTHQIRVHAAYAGHPVVGDDRYGDREINRSLRKMGLKRLFLHAHDLEFRLPDSNKTIHVHAPLPTDLKQLLDKLE
ncbi:MAG TPA: 23S rRNA pseudouridine(955/2504/2580) synthase RluC [Gammaproteobacteria bacterium]|nr:23S rRNA pseudouridine(955/2504/2580) synthase RluC [Gammaproteobacteria bacterium]